MTDKTNMLQLAIANLRNKFNAQSKRGKAITCVVAVLVVLLLLRACS